MFYKFFLKVFVSLVYYVKIPTNIQNANDFVKYHVKTSIKHHLIKSLNLVYDDDVYIFHINGLFKDESEIEFAKKAYSNNCFYKELLFWMWYYSLQIFLKQSNILTTFIYVKDQGMYNLVCISVEYKTRKVYYLLSILINHDDIIIEDLYSFKYMDVLINSLNSGSKIICLGYKTDLLKIGLGAEKQISHITLLDKHITLLDKHLTFIDIVLRFLSTI